MVIIRYVNGMKVSVKELSQCQIKKESVNQTIRRALYRAQQQTDENEINDF